ncbi:MAG TPA: GNAT family N-acetyltransferase [Thermoguttaceae bacterium]|nr:GNAT family N-acetyltransferase [Thermoguttaceae bacterium]
MIDPPLVKPVSPVLHAEALSLVFGHLLPEDRAQRVEALLAGARSGEVPMDGLLAARRGGRLVGGVFSEVQAGRAALVWPPRLASGEPGTTAERLLAATAEYLVGKGVCVAYALLEPGMEDDAPRLREAGFEPVAELLYLFSLDESFPASPPASPVQFESYCPANHDRLARVVEATYRETLDCPRLNGVRQIDDVLAGYRATGVFSPGRWLLVRHRGEDIGCLLLADHPEQENYELVYMGLVPSARGSGWGKDITRRAQWLTCQARRPRLVLAVDAANGPAIRMYSMLGFHAWDRRNVYLWVVNDAR